MLTYATQAGHTFIDRRLYLPKEWTEDRERCQAAGIPDEIAFATKPELAIAMLDRALAAQVPFTWVLADSGYGRDPQLRAWCHTRAVPYVLGVPVDLPLDGPPGKPRHPAVKRADDLLHYARVRDPWERRSCGHGAKGERLYDWTAFAVEVKEERPARDFSHWMVLRRSLHPNRRGKDGQLHPAPDPGHGQSLPPPRRPPPAPSTSLGPPSTDPTDHPPSRSPAVVLAPRGTGSAGSRAGHRVVRADRSRHRDRHRAVREGVCRSPGASDLRR
ncbi:transposase [Streptomyces sp. NPDC005373]|uniref:IS701 family transposase n=1 Tax=Streptomyces sp. NPDC005373 TaxID=3156879 RepID=UPI0033B4538A